MKQKHISLLALLLSGAAATSAQVSLNTVPTRIVGHPKPERNANLPNYNPNLVEGRELFDPSGIAIDTAGSPPILYVSDTGNNRVLAWRSVTGFQSGSLADLVIGQPDLYTTTPAGPGTTFSAGFSAPTGLAVRNGDLYVVDSGNNRVLRFPKPFANVGQQVPNLIIGQPTLTSRIANYPDGKPSAQGISFTTGNGTLTANLAFDSGGDLWLTDPGNRRVLRYHAADIAANPGSFPAAFEVRGQQSPTTFNDLLPELSTTLPAPYTTTQFYVPSGIAFDDAGRLYVTDADVGLNVSRVLIFDRAGTGTTRIIGLVPQNTTNPSQDTLNRTLLVDPSGVFFLPGNQGIGVVDTASSRILFYPPIETWTDPLVAPPATQVFGQNGDFSDRNRNNAPFGATYVPAPGPATLAYPGAAVMYNNDLFVADTLNNRMVDLPLQGASFGNANRVLGQFRYDTNSPNLIEGKEFFFSTESAMAIDNSSGTPHLYVADPGNHRVLGFRDWRGLNANSKADIVLGQPDFQTARCNYPSGDPGKPGQATLCFPVGLAVDAGGNLYVADSGNARVLRFPAPFSFRGTMEPADLVLGQRDFVSKFTDPSQSFMRQPYGLAFTPAISASTPTPNGLLVSDFAENRVLYFKTTNGTFTAADNGKLADKVFGQPGFLNVAPGNDAGSLNQPHHVSTDTDGRLYVADTGNNRVQIFPDPNSQNTATRGATALLSIADNMNQPRGVYVSPLTGEIWVADTNGIRAKRYSAYALSPTNVVVTATIPAASNTLAVIQDQFGDLFLADNSNRVAIYFPGLQAINGASFIPSKPLTPGVVGSICSPGSNCVNGAPVFGNTTAAAQSLSPLPQTLADTQVLYNSQPAPLYYVSPTQINFVVPMGKQPGDVPTTGTADLLVVRPSTGQVLAAGSVQMGISSPAIFQLDFAGTTRRAAVLNEDGSINSPTNPAARGSTISIYGTGQGFTPGGPDDGFAAQGPVSTPQTPIVVIGACRVDDTACTQEPSGNVKYSGLSGFPGGWQINVRIPQNTPINSQTPIFIGINDIFSSDAGSGFRMVIAVK
ncbi:MAG: hypothetical protein C5B51_21530 [Terriglobia bacterium]|nr:MAG: hypothetical protein C5B51_21530 [Terriglobia bacterium]